MMWKQCMRYPAMSAVFLLSFTALLLCWYFTAQPWYSFKAMEKIPKNFTVQPLYSVEEMKKIQQRFAFTMSDEDATVLNAALWEFTQTLEKANISYFMVGGTLLGSHRHHDRIPWDDDVDLAVHQSEKENIRRLFSNSTTYTFLNAHGEKYHWKFFPKNGKKVPGFRYRAPFLDVIWFNDTMDYIQYTCPWFETRFSKSDVYPLRRRPFGKFLLPAPCNITAFLTTEKYNLDICVSRVYNHFDNTYVRNVTTIPCSQLVNLFPLVQRQQQLSGRNTKLIVESLIHKGTVLNEWSFIDNDYSCKAAYTPVAKTTVYRETSTHVRRGTTQATRKLQATTSERTSTSTVKHTVKTTTNYVNFSQPRPT